MKAIPVMPDEFKGKINHGCGYTKSEPRTWTDEEIDWVRSLSSKGYSAKEIAESVGRTSTSVSIKLKRLGKKNNTYNKKHVDEKYAINNEFLEELKPSDVLDVFCGQKNFYKNYDGISNDIDTNIDCEYHMDAIKLCCKLYAAGEKFDLVDLDPFGSAYDCFDLAIKMAKKGLVITLGELGHKRWKRLDYVSRYYDINSIEEFTIENLIAHIQKIGLRNKKQLTVFKYKEWQNIGRVWFKIEPVKITEQWKDDDK